MTSSLLTEQRRTELESYLPMWAVLFVIAFIEFASDLQTSQFAFFLGYEGPVVVEGQNFSELRNFFEQHAGDVYETIMLFFLLQNIIYLMNKFLKHQKLAIITKEQSTALTLVASSFIITFFELEGIYNTADPLDLLGVGLGAVSIYLAYKLSGILEASTQS